MLFNCFDLSIRWPNRIESNAMQMIDRNRFVNHLRDTAGQERFRTITTAYYRGAMGIMLVYDITDEKSFENIKNWIRNIEENASSDVEKMLLGNKCELKDKRQVGNGSYLFWCCFGKIAEHQIAFYSIVMNSIELIFWLRSLSQLFDVDSTQLRPK